LKRVMLAKFVPKLPARDEDAAEGAAARGAPDAIASSNGGGDPPFVSDAIVCGLIEVGARYFGVLAEWEKYNG